MTGSLRATVIGPSIFDDAALAGRGRWQGDDRPAALVRASGAQEIDDAADRSDIAAADDLAVDLTAQIDLDRRIQRDEAMEPAQGPGRVRILGAASRAPDYDERKLAAIAADRGPATVTPLSTPPRALVTTPASHNAATPSPIAPEWTPRSRRSPELGQHGIGNRADADLQRRTILDQRRHDARSRGSTSPAFVGAASSSGASDVMSAVKSLAVR